MDIKIKEIIFKKQFQQKTPPFFILLNINMLLSSIIIFYLYQNNYISQLIATIIIGVIAYINKKNFHYDKKEIESIKTIKTYIKLTK